MEINFESIQIFYLLCEMQSFSMVAKALKKNQSVISRNIKELEKMMGRKLIANNQKPIELTADGKKLYNFAKQINFDAQHVEETIAFKNSEAQSNQYRIFIAISMILGCAISYKVKKLMDAYPELSIDISFTNDINMELINTKDIIVTRRPYKHMLVENSYISEYKMMFGASRSYIQKYGYPQRAESLKYHTFLYVEGYDYEEIASAKIVENLSKNYILKDELCAIQAINEGCGVGIVPKFVANDFPNIVFFEMEEKLSNLKAYSSVSKVKKNSYVDIVSSFLQNEL